ncbi:MAG: hypothetical protein HYS98_03130 [Deltaproteobacteria bacterium]|nr:hypothetical protein [Deltaproteobacteria bacterium]
MNYIVAGPACLHPQPTASASRPAGARWGTPYGSHPLLIYVFFSILVGWSFARGEKTNVELVQEGLIESITLLKDPKPTTLKFEKSVKNFRNILSTMRENCTQNNPVQAIELVDFGLDLVHLALWEIEKSESDQALFDKKWGRGFFAYFKVLSNALAGIEKTHEIKNFVRVRTSTGDIIDSKGRQQHDWSVQKIYNSFLAFKSCPNDFDHRERVQDCLNAFLRTLENEKQFLRGPASFLPEYRKAQGEKIEVELTKFISSGKAYWQYPIDSIERFKSLWEDLILKVLKFPLDSFPLVLNSENTFYSQPCNMINLATLLQESYETYKKEGLEDNGIYSLKALNSFTMWGVKKILNDENNKRHVLFPVLEKLFSAESENFAFEMNDSNSTEVLLLILNAMDSMYLASEFISLFPLQQKALLGLILLFDYETTLAYQNQMNPDYYYPSFKLNSLIRFSRALQEILKEDKNLQSSFIQNYVFALYEAWIGDDVSGISPLGFANCTQRMSAFLSLIYKSIDNKTESTELEALGHTPFQVMTQSISFMERLLINNFESFFSDTSIRVSLGENGKSVGAQVDHCIAVVQQFQFKTPLLKDELLQRLTQLKESIDAELKRINQSGEFKGWLLVSRKLVEHVAELPVPKRMGAISVFKPLPSPPPVFSEEDLQRGEKGNMDSSPAALNDRNEAQDDKVKSQNDGTNVYTVEDYENFLKKVQKNLEEVLKMMK